jgi:hypothetical protein
MYKEEKGIRFESLVGWRIVAIMEDRRKGKHGNLLIYVVDDSPDRNQKVLVADSLNMDYSWFDNWKLMESTESGEIEINDSFKMIGSRVEEVITDGDYHDDNRMYANMDKWYKAVGKGGWGPAMENYWFITIKTGLKIIRLGTIYYDCHYPATIWDVL